MSDESYHYLLIPFIAVVLAQMIKVCLDCLQGKFTRASFTEFGGMPSSHTALFTSLATLILLKGGGASAEFAISFFVLLLVMRDATGFRETLEDYGRAVNVLLKKNRVLSTGRVKENIGHTVPEVVAGFLLGAAVTLFLYVINF